jgi:hypothetical protein
MPDREISADAEEGFRRLHELFGAVDPSASPKRGCRKYVLEFRGREPVFRDANSGRDSPRSETELAVDRIFDEVMDNDIVPRKLSEAFPGSSFEPSRY